MKLPPIISPQKYAGLYVYEFPRGVVFPNGHVSVGYTAGEILVLRKSEAYGGGTAYEIYRATAEGMLELRAVLDRRLAAQEAMCFLRADEAAARRDFEALRAAADRTPLPCAVELLLARLHEFEPSDLTALSYSAAATTAMAGWLDSSATRAGDQVVCGIDAHAALVTSEGLRIASCQLPTLVDYRDRPAEEVLQAVRRSLQR